MDVLDRVKPESESISIAQCRELLGEDAETMSDEEVLGVAHHAESLARVVIELAMQHVLVRQLPWRKDTPCQRPMMALRCPR